MISCAYNMYNSETAHDAKQAVIFFVADAYRVDVQKHEAVRTAAPLLRKY